MVSLKLMSKEVDSLTTSQMSMKSQKQETERIRYLAKTYRRCRLILIERAHGYHCYGEKEVKVAGLWVHHLHYIMNGFNGMKNIFSVGKLLMENTDIGMEQRWLVLFTTVIVNAPIIIS